MDGTWKSFAGPHFRVPEPVDCISFKCTRIRNLFETDKGSAGYFYGWSELEMTFLRRNIVCAGKNIKGLNKVQFNREKKRTHTEKHSLSSN